MESTDTSPPNILKDFMHARGLLKSTSRGKNPDWYRDAFLLTNQLHLVASAMGYRAFLREPEEEGWKEISPIPEKYDESFLEGYISEVRSNLPRGTRSLGVILHLNSDASVFEFPIQDWEAEHNGLSLEQLISNDPGAVLQDRTLSGDDMSFRVYPVPASPLSANTGVAVASSRRGEDLLSGLRALGDESNFPIRTHALNSPLLLLSRLPRTFGPQDTAFCTLLRYEGFSFCGFFNGSGELVLLKSLRHAQNELPPNLETILATTAASVEISELVVKAFDCRSVAKTPLEDELARLLFQVPFQVFLPPNEKANQFIELTVFDVADDNPNLGFSETESFSSTISQGYHLQDFLSPSLEELNALPGAVDMKLLRTGRLLGRLGLVACLGFAAYATMVCLKKTSSDDWKTNATSSNESTNLNAEISKLERTEKLIGGRSKGWVAMELYSQLFPLDGSVQLASADYKVGANGNIGKVGNSGFVKTWTLRGFASNSITKEVGRINSEEGMGKIFDGVQEVTGSSSMDLSPATRDLSVNLDLSRNQDFVASAPRGSSESFPYSFNLDITQKVASADSLSIPIQKL